MPLYYFHIACDGYCSTDDVGINLSDLGEAHYYALKLILKLRAHLAREDEDGWIVKVTDQSGAMPLAVLSSSVPWSRAAKPAPHVSRPGRQEKTERAQDFAANRDRHGRGRGFTCPGAGNPSPGLATPRPRQP